jgi:hypothetical protein
MLLIDPRNTAIAAADAFGRGLGRSIANSTQACQNPGIGTDPSSANPGH